MKYKDYFANFYRESILLKNIKSDWMLNIEKGLFLCLLEKYFYSETFPLNKELSAEEIFELLNIDTKSENIDVNLFNTYMISQSIGKLEDITVKIKDNIIYSKDDSNFKPRILINSDYVTIDKYLLEINLPLIIFDDKESLVFYSIQMSEIDDFAIFSRGKQVFPTGAN